MKVSALSKRFAELTSQWEAVEKTKEHGSGAYAAGFYVNPEDLLNWRVKARNLISVACQQKSVHFAEFVKVEQPDMYRTNYGMLKELGAVFQAAKEDFEGGYLNSIRNLVQAEVFDNELDQAKELLTNGYSAAAAVIAGVVLETTLRQLCADRNLSIGKLDKMNADLAKDDCYSLLVQKRITALADIRNNAAHGHRAREIRQRVVLGHPACITERSDCCDTEIVALPIGNRLTNDR